MNRIKAFGAFWYDFVIGDDWHVAALIVAGLALTAILTHAAKVNAWWLLPVVALVSLGYTVLLRQRPRPGLAPAVAPSSEEVASS